MTGGGMGVSADPAEVLVAGDARTTWARLEWAAVIALQDLDLEAAQARASAMQATAGDDQLALAWAHLANASCALRRSQAEETRRLAQLAHTSFAALGDPLGEAWSLQNLAYAAYLVGDPARAFAQLTRARGLFEACGEEEGRLAVAGNLSMVASSMDDVPLAVTLLSEALRASPSWREQRPRLYTRLLNNLSVLLLDRGRWHEALQLAGEVRELARLYGYVSLEACALLCSATAKRGLGYAESSRRRAQVALVRFGAFGDQRLRAQILCELGRTHLDLGQHREALRAWLAGRRDARHSGDLNLELELTVLGALAWHQLGRRRLGHSLLVGVLKRAQARGLQRVVADTHLALSNWHERELEYAASLHHYRAFQGLDRRLYHTSQDLQVQAQLALFEEGRARSEREWAQQHAHALRLKHEELEQQAGCDALTGVMNRRAFEIALETSLAGNGPVTLLLIDIDHFKSVNDTYGHAAGDAVLVGVARALKGAARADEVVARWGGEEFAVLLHAAVPAAARQAAERLRRAVAGAAWAGLGPASVTASAGVAVWSVGEDPDQLFQRADAALYAAKDDGRDRCCLAEEAPA